MSKLALLGGTPVRTEPFPAWPVHDEREVEAVTEVVRSGDWGGIPGHLAEQFAARFAEMQGACYGACNCNGTTSLEIALKALGVGPGDEVIVPSLTFYATASAVIFMNAVPVIVDVDPRTWAILPEAVEAAITPRTVAVCPVHLYGSIADLDAINAIARRRHLLVVEDCAHMHGGQWRGRGVGSWGDAGCFSLQQSKAMTSGEGGILLTNDAAVANICHSLINCGRFAAGDAIRKPVLGWNYRLTELQAAILLVQLDRLPEQLAAKRHNAALLEERLRQIEGVELLEVYEGVTGRAFYAFGFRYTGQPRFGLSRELFCRALQAEGIPATPGTYPPLQRAPLYTDWEQQSASRLLGKRMNPSAVHTPAADQAAYEEAVLFSHQVLLAGERGMHDIADAVAKVLARVDELVAWQGQGEAKSPALRTQSEDGRHRPRRL